MNKLLPLSSAVAVVGAATIGHAATIDFTDSTTAAAVNGKSSYTYANVAGTGVDVTVSASGAKNAVVTAQAGSGLQADGLGISSGVADTVHGAADEINGKELLTISFSKTVTVESVSLTDLYSTRLGTLVPDKTGSWTLYDASGNAIGSNTFTGEQNVLQQGTITNGALTIDIGQLASSIALQSTTSGGIAPTFRGFSVASVSFERAGGTPELSTTGASSAAIVLAGASILFASRRRRRLVEPER